MRKCQRDEIAPIGMEKIARRVEVATLEPIADVILDERYFSLVSSVLHPCDRLTITRFNNDAREKVVEYLPLALVDVGRGGRISIYPKSEIKPTGVEPERGWVKAKRDGEFIVRRDGRTVERCVKEEQADWFLEARLAEERALTAGRSS